MQGSGISLGDAARAEPQEIEDEEYEQVLEQVAAIGVAKALGGWCASGRTLQRTSGASVQDLAGLQPSSKIEPIR